MGTRSLSTDHPPHRQTGADVQGLRALGALGVITKPFDPMTLAEEIRALFATGALV